MRLSLYAPLLSCFLLVTSMQSTGHCDKPTTMTYPVSDLPVYRVEKGKTVFDPSLLVTAIKTEVEPMSWDYLGGVGKIVVQKEKEKQKDSLVITQDEAVHKKISRFIGRLRNPNIGPHVSPFGPKKVAP